MKPNQDGQNWVEPLLDIQPEAEQTKDAAPVPIDPREGKRRQYRLNQLMMLSVVCAILFYFIGQAARTGTLEDTLLAVFAVSVVLVVGGILLLQRSTKSTFGAWTLVAVGLVGVFGIALTWFSIPFIVLCLICISQVNSRYRAMQQDSLLWALALASDRSMPLGPSIRAFSYQLGGGFRKLATSVAECLDNGMPLPDALEFVHRVATPSSIVLARVGWDSGALPLALRTATADRLGERSTSRTFGNKIAYMSMMLIAIQTVIMFIMYFIMPKFEAIFADFGTSLPPVTIMVIKASHAMSTFGAGPLLLLAEIAFLIYLPYAINGWGNLSIPIFDRLFVRRHRLLILKSIAIVVGNGQPVALAVLSLSRSYPTPWIRRRLVTAWRGIEAGLGWADALRSEGLLSEADSEVLIAAERLGNLEWAFRELSQSGERRHAQRMEVVSQLLFAFVLIGAGALVGMLCVAYFLPLVDLISRLSG